jgi:hypothetical protein
LHYNFSFGNLPQDIYDAEFQNKFRQCWICRAEQRDNIWHDTIAGDVKKAVPLFITALLSSLRIE